MFCFSYKKSPGAIPVATVLDKPQLHVNAQGKKTMKTTPSGDPLVGATVFVVPREQACDSQHEYDYKSDVEFERKMRYGRPARGLSKKDEQFLREHALDDEEKVAKHW